MKGKKWTAMVLVLVLMCATGASGLAQVPEDLLGKIKGTYVSLFDTVCAPEYDQVWLDACIKFGGEENAEATAQMLKTVCVGELYGEAAVAAYTGKEEQVQFNCSFLGGVEQFTFDGNTFSGVDKDGNTVFSHQYSYVEQNNGMGMDMAVYKTDDANAGEFTYFLLAPDSPDETFHIEFRYGSDLDALNQMRTGSYAYWLAAGIPATDTVEYGTKAVTLFCEENIPSAEEATDEAA